MRIRESSPGLPAVKVLTVLGALCAFASAARADCDRDDDGRPKHGLHVHVSTAADLQAKVADARYANYRIVLSPGTYNLVQPTPAPGAPPAPITTLALQPGQSIVGVQGLVDRDWDGVPDPVSTSADPADPATDFVRSARTTIVLPHINTSLPGCSHPYAPTDSAATCNDASGDTAGIRMHNGNSLEGVTVRGWGTLEGSATNRNAVKCEYEANPSHLPCRVTNTVIQHEYTGFGGAGNLVEIAGSVIQDTGGSMEIGFGGIGPGRTSNIVLLNNRITGSAGVVDPVTGAVVMSGGNGIIVNNYASSDNTIRFTTTGNIMDRHTSEAVLLMAGLSFGGNGPASNNTIEWNSVDDRIWRNGWADGNDCLSASPTFCGWGTGGVFLISANENNSFDLHTGGPVDNPIPSSSHNNRIIVNLFGTSFVHDKSVKGPENLFAGFNVNIGSLPEASSLPSTDHDNTISVSARGVTSVHGDGILPFWVLDDLSSPPLFPGSITKIRPGNAASFNRLNNGLTWPLCNNASPETPDVNCAFNSQSGN